MLADDLPRLIITDLNMQVITGFKLLQDLNGMKRYQYIDVFVYSLSRLGSHTNMCLASGTRDYITKP
jgi:CheY-like chemotaxis protein